MRCLAAAARAMKAGTDRLRSSCVGQHSTISVLARNHVVHCTLA